MVDVEFGRCAVARRVNNATASERARGASSTTASPSTPSGTWLVHRIRSPGAASRRRPARAAAASTTCSQLSRITNAAVPLQPLEQSRFAAGDVHRGDQHVDDVVCRGRGLESCQPEHRTADAFDRLSLRPTAIATAVFPTPPEPTISTSRSVASRSHRAVTSASRPTRSADIDGRFPCGARGRCQVADRNAERRRPGSGSAARAAAAAVQGRDRARRPAGFEPAGTPPGHRLDARPGTAR